VGRKGSPRFGRSSADPLRTFRSTCSNEMSSSESPSAQDTLLRLLLARRIEFVDARRQIRTMFRFLAHVRPSYSQSRTELRECYLAQGPVNISWERKYHTQGPPGPGHSSVDRASTPVTPVPRSASSACCLFVNRLVLPCQRSLSPEVAHSMSTWGSLPAAGERIRTNSARGKVYLRSVMQGALGVPSADAAMGQPKASF
jgi:hypothetical protein